MSRLHLAVAGATTAIVAVATAFGIAFASYHQADERDSDAPVRDGHVQTYWPGGVLKSDIVYRNDVYDGEYRTFYATGAPYELRHYVRGHEAGVQRSWGEDGTLYLNYEVHDGRRYGLVNASPCNVVGAPGGAAAAPGSAAAAPRATDLAGASAIAVADRGPTPTLPYYDEPTFTPRWAPVSHSVAPFALTTQEGRPISGASLAGRPYVASFVYTSCAAVCPILVSQLSRVQASLGRASRIVSFSVTPDTDTPAVLRTFGHERGIDPSRWSLVTGSKRTIYTLARTSYFADDSRVGSAPDDETAFLHSEKLLLVDGDGHLRGVYNGTQPHAVDQLVDDYRQLLRTSDDRP